MQYRRLGRSGLKLSEFSLGSWITFSNQVDEADAIEIMALAHDNGINFFDNAEVYHGGESERLMGNALAKLGWSRDSYAVSSKVFWGGDAVMQNGLNRKHVFDACHAAMKRLQVDYLDLFYCHRPDPETPIGETVRAMHDLVTQGKVMYWGTSEWTVGQLLTAITFARNNGLVEPAMEQPEYNLFKRHKVEVEFKMLYEEVGLGTTTFSPLSSGTLTGKYANGIPKGSRFDQPGFEWVKQEWMGDDRGAERFAKLGALSTLADEAGLPLHHMALLWCLNNPNVSSVILGASRKEQLADNLSALDARDRLTDDVLAKIDTIMGSPCQPVV